MIEDERARVPRPPFSTIPEDRAAAVVVAAPGALLLSACREAIRYGVAARIEVADVKGAATHVAATRPFAIVIDEDVFAFDPREFEALARDVGAELVTVPSASSRGAVLGWLLPKLSSALKTWERRDEPPS